MEKNNHQKLPEGRPAASPHQPLQIILLSMIFFLLSARELLRFIQVLFYWNMLTALQITVSPLFIALPSLFLGIFGIIVLWGLWPGKPWSRLGGFAFSVLYAFKAWLELLLAPDPLSLQNRWPFQLTITILGLAVVSGLLVHRSSKQHFQRHSP